MSEKFNGFSQDEIKKYSVQNQKNIAPVSSTKTPGVAFRGCHEHGIRRMTDKMVSKGIPKKQQANKITQHIPSITDREGTVSNDDTFEEFNMDQSMSKSIEEALFYQHKKKTTGNVASTEMSSKDTARETIRSAFYNANDANADNSSILHLPDQNDTSTDSSTSCIVFDDSTILPRSKNKNDFEGIENALSLDSPFKGISLKDFETHRKMIEEQNKQKKEMLYKAVEQYSLKTAAEARKIEEIKSELSKLDNGLALDVAILRKQIDMACMHFANMEKQYIKIESQFLKAKMDLHNAAEKKELLTEHLCTVIAHNEDRKAQKLSELMQKVGLTSTGELEATEIFPKDTSI